MSTTPSPEIWNSILKGNVEKDDPLWKEYLDKAAVFDVRMVDEWNRIVDVLLVYVGLFISVLTSFIANTSSRFQRNPAEVTNDLLVAIYNQQVAQSNNTSIPPVNTTSYFNLSQADYHAAVTQNALLYISLSLSIIVSVIALAAKLWLVSYSHQAFSVGSPYDRAMKRQEAYNGVLVWNLGGVIHMLPVILLIALCLFGFYVYTSVSKLQSGIGVAVGVLLSVGLMFLGFASLAAAFVSGCPFRSAFSDVIRFIFEMLPTLLSKCRCPSSSKLKWLLIGTLTLLWFASLVVVEYHAFIPGGWFSIFSLVVTIPVACSLQQVAAHKPQKYRISGSATLLFLSASLTIILSILTISFTYQILPVPVLISLLSIGVLGIFSAGYMTCKMSKSMADTGETDAIAWLLITTPQYPATFFKKAGQITGFDSIGRHYRPRLLASLMPLLTPLITSYHTPKRDIHSPTSIDFLKDRLRGPVNDDMVPIDENSNLKNLEIYLACLARLSEFENRKGTFDCLWEDAKQHPKLEQPLIDKLVELADPQCHSKVARSAATKVLNNYKLDTEGYPLGSLTTGAVLASFATDSRGEAMSMLIDNDLNSQEQGHAQSYRPLAVDPATGTHVKPAHSSEEVEEVRRDGLVELANPQRHSQVMRSAATKVLNNYNLKKLKLNTEGNHLRSPATVLESVATDPRGEAILMLNGLNGHDQGHPESYRLVGLTTRKDLATHKDPAKHVEPATRVEPASAATSMLNVSELNNQELPKLYRPVDPATRKDLAMHEDLAKHIGSATRKDLATHEDLAKHVEPATRVEPASAATSMLYVSELNNQELPKLYRPVDPATRVEPEECDEEIEAVGHEIWRQRDTVVQVKKAEKSVKGASQTSPVYMPKKRGIFWVSRK